MIIICCCCIFSAKKASNDRMPIANKTAVCSSGRGIDKSRTIGVTHYPGTWYLVPPFGRARVRTFRARLTAHSSSASHDYAYWPTLQFQNWLFFPGPRVVLAFEIYTAWKSDRKLPTRLARCPPPATDPTERRNVKSTVLRRCIPSIHIVGH